LPISLLARGLGWDSFFCSLWGLKNPEISDTDCLIKSYFFQLTKQSTRKDSRFVKITKVLIINKNISMNDIRTKEKTDFSDLRRTWSE